jgi:hypothetical protein
MPDHQDPHLTALPAAADADAADAAHADAPPSPEEAAAAAQLAQALDALDQGRAGLDALPPARDDDLHALAALGLLLRAAEGGADLPADRQAAVWERISQRAEGRPLATPPKPMTWWRWLWVALPSAAAIALLMLWSSAPNPSATHPPTAPRAAEAAAPASPRAPLALNTDGLPASVAALDADAPRVAARLQARQVPTTGADTALRDLRRARLDAWRQDIALAHRAAPTPPTEAP